MKLTFQQAEDIKLICVLMSGACVKMLSQEKQDCEAIMSFMGESDNGVSMDKVYVEMQDLKIKSDSIVKQINDEFGIG